MYISCYGDPSVDNVDDPVVYITLTPTPKPTQTFQPTRTYTPTPTNTPTRTPTPTIACNGVTSQSVSVNDYHMWGECPGAGSPCPSGTGVATCSNFSGSGTVTSQNFLKSCMTTTPYAYASVSFDNTGTIGTLSDNGSGRPECSLGSASGNVPVTITDLGNYIRLSVNYTYQNAQHGGPYGIAGNVTFYIA